MSEEKMNGTESIAAERRRQIEIEGWTPESDDAYVGGELAIAAACYVDGPGKVDQNTAPPRWPWLPIWWKPRTRREDLVRAGALIAAEIDRLDRLAACAVKTEG